MDFCDIQCLEIAHSQLIPGDCRKDWGYAQKLDTVVHYSDQFSVLSNVGSSCEKSTLETNRNCPTQSSKLGPKEKECSYGPLPCSVIWPCF